MSDWIEINLPYNKYLTSEEIYDRYEAESDLMSKFDTWLKEKHNIDLSALRAREEELNNYIDLKERAVSIDDDEPLSDQYDKIRQKLEEEGVYDDLSKVESDIGDAEEYILDNPEYQEKLQELNDKLKNERPKCFASSEYNKPGVLIEIDDNGKLQQYLIGSINGGGGVCDCCRCFNNDAIVKRCKIIWEN